MTNLPDQAEVVVNLRGDGIYTFEENLRYKIELSDFINASISGHLKFATEALKSNFESCLIREMTFEGVRLVGCDFLDTHVVDSRFMDCDLDQSHFAGCIINNVNFVRCRFHFTNDTDTTFINCSFEECYFERFIFKYCRFSNCSFSMGKTTNRLFDTCTITDTTFFAMTLQVATIYSNIGLRLSDFHQCLFRTERSYEGHAVLDLDELVSCLASGVPDPFRTAMAVYFVEGASEAFHENVDGLFSDIGWFGNFVSKSVNEKLSGLASLLFYLYEKDDLLAILLLKLQDFLNSLSTQMERSQSQPSRSVMQTIDGLRLQTARQIQGILNLVEAEAASFDGIGRVALDGEGPLSRTFYSELLDFLPASDVRVVNVRPRNSPLLIEIDLLTVGAYAWIAALVLATRFRYQFNDIAQSYATTPESAKLPDVASSEGQAHQVPALRRPAFDLQVGALDDGHSGFGIQAMALFTSGICHRFHLSFSMRRAFALHRHISSIFSTDENGSKDRSRS